MSEVNSVTGLGTVAKPLPRVMIVDTPGVFFSSLANNPDSIRKKFGCEPVFVLYNPELNLTAEMEEFPQSNVKRFVNVASITQYALDPESKIDMVLTGNAFRGEKYGQQICADLKNAPEAFKGQVALQGMHHPHKEAQAKAVGAIGFYDKMDFTEADTSALKALMDAHTQSQGQALG
jgi:hypothetical protein